MTKFSFSPGLPGYGSQGVDGSAGDQGLGIYFSAYSGTTESVTINSRIDNNLDLTLAGNALPEDREYQTGDLFIDTTGKVFNIDLAGGLTYDKYAWTGSELASSSEFNFVKNTISTGFARYANDWSTNKRIYDQVYTNNVITDYTTIPTALYIDELADFGKIDYVDYNVNSYFPYQAWVAGSADANAIALVREAAANIWHFGNLDGSDVQRSVNLNLDFSITTTIDISANDISASNININDTIYSVDGLDGTTPTNPIDVTIFSGRGGNSSSATAGTAGGDVSIYAGKGGECSSTGLAGRGGNFLLFSGAGADASGTVVGSIGGNIEITGGDGGNTFSTSSGDRGAGGNILISAGISGTVDDVPSQLQDDMGYIHFKTGNGSDDLTPAGGEILLDATSSPNGVATDVRGKIRIHGSVNEIYGYSTKLNEYSSITWDSNANLTIDSSGADIFITNVDASILIGTNADPTSEFIIHASKIRFGDPLVFDISMGIGPARIFSGGYDGAPPTVGVGTMACNFYGDNAGATNADPTVLIHNADITLTSLALGIQAGETSPADQDYVKCIRFFDNGGTERGGIEFDDNNPRFFNAASDQRLKGNIKDADINGLEILNNIPVRSFEMRLRDASGNLTKELTGEEKIGWIAQEVMPHWSRMISYQDKNDPNAYLSLSEVSLIPVLHKSIQELSSENNDLKNRVDQLESLVNQLIAKVDPTIS